MAKGATLILALAILIGCSGGGSEGSSAMSPEAAAAAKNAPETPAPAASTDLSNPTNNPAQVGGGVPINPGDSGR